MRKTLILITLCSGFFAFGQTNEPPATIVTMKGDTLKGNMRLANSLVNPSFVDFIADGRVTRYSPGDLRSFSVAGMQFVSAVVSFYTGTLDMNMLAESYVEQKTSDAVFLRLLVTGKYLLYGYRNETRQYFFIQKSEDAPVELVFRRKMKERILAEDKTYQSQLAGLAENEQKSTSFVEQAYYLSYDANELIAYVSKINGLGIPVKKDVSDKINVNVEAGGGLMIPIFIASGETITAPINSIKAENTIAPVVGAALLFSKNPKYSLLRLMFNTSISSFTVRGRSENITLPGQNYFEQYDFRITQLNTGIGVMQLLSSKGPVRLYVSGIAQAGLLLSKASNTELINVSDGSLFTTYRDYPPLQRITVSGTVSAGVAAGRFRTELFFQTPFRIAAQNKSNFSAMAIGIAARVALKKY